MNITLEPGLYVVAVSGGVDSMVLLDVLRRLPGLQLVVAHFDHGIRSDSAEDRRLVEEVAYAHGLEFACESGHLGAEASEDTARRARYDFLQRVRTSYGAEAIVTAHHQDDALETAVHNLLRGSGRLGVTALRSRDKLVRPLLHVSKAEVLAYARKHGLRWREDSTNTDMRYRRNYIRHNIIANLTPNQREELLQHIRRLEQLNAEIDTHLTELLPMLSSGDGLRRHWLIMLPHDVSREVLAAWLRKHGILELTSMMLERLVMAAKTYRPGKQADIDKHHVLLVGEKRLAIRQRER